LQFFTPLQPQMENAKRIIKSTTFLAILTCWLWSTAFAGVKIGLQYNAPFQFGGMRFILAGLMLFIYIGKPGKIIKAFIADWKFILLLSVVQFSAQYAFFYKGMNLVPGALGAMIIGSSPIFIAVIAHFSIKTDRMEPVKMISIFIGLIGIAIITLGRTKVEIKNELELLGIGLLFANNILSGYSNVLVSKYQTGRSPMILSSTSLFIGGLMLFAIAIPTEGINWGPFPCRLLYFAVLAGIFIGCSFRHLVHFIAKARSQGFGAEHMEISNPGFGCRLELAFDKGRKTRLDFNCRNGSYYISLLMLNYANPQTKRKNKHTFIVLLPSSFVFHKLLFVLVQFE
jgi:drug/metabolite transporter (DMT)-like permease